MLVSVFWRLIDMAVGVDCVATVSDQAQQNQTPAFWIYMLFLASGVPALIYQIV